MIKWNFIQDESKHNLTDTKIDATFRKLSKNAVCFHIWKVEQDRIETIPKTQYGTFYDDSTYIIYAASTSGTYVNQETITRELKNPSNLERFIHFWLGSETTPQRSGNVAYKVMELDTYFNNLTTQYRETQENESTRFLSYFKKGIIILSGELSETNPKSRLFHVKGKKWITCIEMKTINWEHFNSASVMILQTPKYIFVWIGRSSTPSERRGALNLAKNMQELYQITDITIVDDGYEQSMNEPRKQEWNQYLSLKNRFVHQINSIGPYPKSILKLYKCGYITGKYRIEEIKTGCPEQCDLNDSETAFIIDGSFQGVWVWVGKSVQIQEKIEAMRNARGFVKKKKYPSLTPVVKVIEGHEPLEFIRLFPSWQYDTNNNNNNNNKITKIIGKLDSLTLLQRPKMAAETQLIDDGSGEKHIFRVTDGHYVELPRQKSTPFFSEDCYILQYSVALTETGPGNQNENGVKYILYLWCGHNVKPDIKLKSETLAFGYFENLEKKSMMVKIAEGFETPHFLQIFNGKFIVFTGKGLDYDLTGFNTKTPSSFILKIFGDSTYNSKAIQVDPLLTMSSKDCFVIKSLGIWIWCGQCSTGDVREVAKNIGNLLGEYNLVIESKESDEFWQAVSDKFGQNKTNGYHNDNNLPIIKTLDIYDKSRAGLYISYLEQDNLMTREILAFEQTDLTPEDIYLLDIGNMIFIWIGDLSSQEERDVCWLMARHYLKTYPVYRDENTSIALIHQGYEPNIFIGFFDSWDTKYWNNHVSYETMRQYMESSISPIASSIQSINGETDFDKHQKYPLSVLQQEADILPAGVNPIRKEVHLTHDDFVEIFNMKFAEFDTLPGWKKQELKKKHKLF